MFPRDTEGHEQTVRGLAPVPSASVVLHVDARGATRALEMAGDSEGVLLRLVVMGQDGPGERLSRRHMTTCDGPIYLPSFVLRASAKPHRPSRKMIVPTMASVITSATVFVSTMNAASASRPRPLARTNRQSFNLLTATTRLTRSSLLSVRSPCWALVRHTLIQPSTTPD